MSNATIFWIMVSAIIIQVIAIVVFGFAIKTVAKIKVDNIKKEQNKGKTIASLILVLISSQIFAGNPAEDPIFNPSAQELWGLLLVNMILLTVLLYFKHILDTLSQDFMPNRAIEEKTAWYKINKVLTNAVDLDKEETVLMDHEYDGIQELDNNLPPWWKWGFYATIVFAFIYIGHYHILKTGDLQIAEYENNMAYEDAKVEEYLKLQNLNVTEKDVTILTDPAEISKGVELFQKNCVSCHGPNGEGGIGVNFTDNHWIYGNDIKEVFKVIKYGANNGMRSWQDDFNGQQMQQIASYILSIQGTFVENGKEAQGTLFESNWPEGNE